MAHHSKNSTIIPERVQAYFSLDIAPTKIPGSSGKGIFTKEGIKANQ